MSENENKTNKTDIIFSIFRTDEVYAVLCVCVCRFVRVYVRAHVYACVYAYMYVNV